MCDDHEQVEDDVGPWFVNVWYVKGPEGRPKVVLQSDDFSHDVALEISGDFSCLDQKIQYAEMLAARMNQMPGTRPLNWLQLEREKRDAADKERASYSAYATKEST